MTTLTNQRSFGIDLLRLVAILAVLVGHVRIDPIAKDIIYTWHVPVFFVLSGFFWRGGKRFREEVETRARSLLLPYLAWTVALSLVAIPLAAEEGLRPLVRRVGSVALGGAYVKTPYTVFWFFTCLFFACLICRLAELRGIPWVAIFTVGVSASLVGPWLAFAPWSVGLAVPCCSFIALGIGIKRAPEWCRDGRLGVVALSCGACAVYLDLGKPLDVKNGDFGYPISGMLITCLICFGLVTSFQSLSKGTGPLRKIASTVVSKYASAFLLAHGLGLLLYYGTASSSVVILKVLSLTIGLLVLARVGPWRRWLLR